MNDSSDEESNGEVLVINSPSPSDITYSQDTSHVSVITVGEDDTPLKVKDSRLEDYPPWDSTSSIGKYLGKYTFQRCNYKNLFKSKSSISEEKQKTVDP